MKKEDVNSLSDEIEFELFKKQKEHYEKKKQRIIKKRLKQQQKGLKVKVPNSIMKIIIHWNTRPLRKLKLDTKLFYTVVESLKQLRLGHFFQYYMFEDKRLAEKYIGRKIMPEEIMKAIDNFALVTDNVFYAASKKQMDWYKRQSLKHFVYRENYTNNSKVSLLIKYMEYQPKQNNMTNISLPDKYPELSSRLKKLYIKNVISNANVELTEREMNHFKIGAEMLHSFFTINKHRITSLLRGEQELPDLLFKALEESSGGRMQRIKPWKFSSSNTFNHEFPAYLVDQGILNSDKIKIMKNDIDLGIYDDPE